MMHRGYRAILTASILLAVALWPSASVQGATTTTYTTTADFDSGGKNDPGQAWFASNGIDQPSNWEAKPRAWSHTNGDIYTVWQGDFDYKIYISKWTNITRLWSSPVVVVSSNPVAGDGHGSPSLAITTDGRIHVFCCSHATNMLHYRSTAQYDITTWEARTNLTSQTTYANAFVHPANGTLYLFYREGSAHDSDWVLRFSTDHGVTWSSAITIISYSPVNFGVYISNMEWDTSGSMYFSWSRETTPLGRHNLYAARFSLTNHTVWSINGSFLGPSIDMTESEASAKVRTTDINTEVFYPAVHLVGGNPFVTYLVEDVSAMDLNYVRWDGSSWSANATINTTFSANNMGDFRVLSSTDVRAYYPYTSVDVTGGGILYEWRWDGLSWSQTALPIMGSSWSHAPMVIHNAIPTNAFIVFDERYPETSNLDSRLWAYGDNGFLYHSETSGSYGVETYTDNTVIANGSFEIANPLRENFTYNDTDARTYVWDGLRRGLSDQVIGCSQSISSGVLTQSLDTSTTVNACAIRSAWNLTGDFDIRIKADITDIGTNHQRNLMVLDQAVMPNGAGPYAAGTNGIVYRILNTDIHALFNVSNGVVSQIGSDTFVVCEPCWMRFVKSGTSFTNYRSTDGTAWTADEATTITGMPSSVYVYFETLKTANADGPAANEVDEFSVISGGVGGTPYRVSASWDTPTRVWDGEVVSSIIVTYTGASASTYIDRIAVLNGTTNQILFSDETDRTSGTSVTVPIHENDRLALFGNGFKVRITLAGTGTPSVVITEVTVGTTRSVLEIAIKDTPYIFIFFFFIVLGLMGAWWVKRRRE